MPATMLMAVMIRPALGVAADEFAGAVHGPVEFAFLDDLGSALVGLGFGDDPCVQVGVDCHLLAGIASRVKRRTLR